MIWWDNDENNIIIRIMKIILLWKLMKIDREI